MVSIQLTWRSVCLGMDTKVNVLLPENRHKIEDISEKSYPVLYLLHGSSEDNDTWMRMSNLCLLVQNMDLIVVMPTTYRGNYVDNKYGLPYYSYLAEELPVKLKNYFHVNIDERKSFIMGDSMGGYGALRIGLSKPKRFSKVFCLSGGNFKYEYKKYFGDDFVEGIFGTEEEYQQSDNNLYHLIKKCEEKEYIPELYFFCGTEDGAYQDNYALYRTCKETLNTNVVGEFFEGKHDFYFWNKALEKAMKVIEKEL